MGVVCNEYSKFVYTNDRIKKKNKDRRPRNIAIIAKIYQAQHSPSLLFLNKSLQRSSQNINNTIAS